ncbi:MAG: hypothetical protein DDT21_02729 [Syntrophomonadaceae bacterium]|nr:hypothetical protein [Bacillota bacterium]
MRRDAEALFCGQIVDYQWLFSHNTVTDSRSLSCIEAEEPDLLLFPALGCPENQPLTFFIQQQEATEVYVESISRCLHSVIHYLLKVKGGDKFLGKSQEGQLLLMGLF